MTELLSAAGLILGSMLLNSTPLIFDSLGGTISERAGVVNIGLEGIMVIGAFAGAAVGHFLGNPWIGFFAGGVAGAILSSFHAVATVFFKADHVISGIAINFLGPGIALFSSKLFFENATQTPPLTEKIPKIFSGVFPQYSFPDLVFGQDATVYLAFFTVLVVWFGLYKTSWGLRLRSIGEHPKAAESLGINVYRIKFTAVVLSGFLAGLGGSAMSMAIMSYFSPSLIAGQGFIALAAMIFGKWKPQGAMLACLFFGFAKSLEVYLGRFALPTQLLALLPYVMTILVLVFFVGKAIAPKAVGQTYGKDW